MTRQRIDRGLYKNTWANTDGEKCVSYYIDVTVAGERVQRKIPGPSRGPNVVTRRSAVNHLAKIRTEMAEKARHPDFFNWKKNLFQPPDDERESILFDDFVEIYLDQLTGKPRFIMERRRRVQALLYGPYNRPRTDRFRGRNGGKKGSDWQGFRGLQLHEVTPARVREMLTILQQENASNASLRNYKSAVSQIFELALMDGQVFPGKEFITANPVKASGIPNYKVPPRTVSWLKPKEWRDLVAACVEPPDSCRDPQHLSVLVEMFCLTGCRKSELTELPWSEVFKPTKRYSHGYIKIPASRRKNKIDLTVKLSPRMAEILERQERLYGREDPVFRGKNGEAYGESTYRKRLEKAVGEAGLSQEDNPGIERLESITTRTFRNTMATNAARAGVPPIQIQAMGGWENLEMVWRYVKAAEEDEVAEGRDQYYSYIITEQDQAAKAVEAADSP